jgi:hypothetical protein
MSVMNTQALGVGGEGRINDARLKHAPGVGVHDRPGVLASGRALGRGTVPRRLGVRRGVRPDASAPALTRFRSMNTPAPQLTHALPQSATPRPIAARRRGSASPDRTTWGETFAETAPIIDAPAFFGPPIAFVLGPWLLLVLLLIGPFALIATVLVVLAVAAGLLAVCVAVIASPYLLIRRLRAHDRVRGKPRAPVHLFRKHRVSSGRLGSPKPKGS